MKRIWKCNKGITLVEILITLALVVPVLGIVFSLFIYSHKSFSKEEMNYDIQNDVRLVTDYIVRTTRNATSLEIISVSTSESEIDDNELFNYIYIDDDGTVHSYLTDGAGGFVHLVLGKNISNTSSFFSKYDNNTLKIYIESVRDTQNYHSEVNVNLINFALFDPSPEISVNEADYKALKFQVP